MLIKEKQYGFDNRKTSNKDKTCCSRSFEEPPFQYGRDMKTEDILKFKKEMPNLVEPSSKVDCVCGHMSVTYCPNVPNYNFYQCEVCKNWDAGHAVERTEKTNTCMSSIYKVYNTKIICSCGLLEVIALIGDRPKKKFCCRSCNDFVAGDVGRFL